MRHAVQLVVVVAVGTSAGFAGIAHAGDYFYLTPEPCASVLLEQGTWWEPGMETIGISCFPAGSGGPSGEVGLARAYATGEQPFDLHCAHAVVVANTAPSTVTANVLLGTPDQPYDQLTLVATLAIDIPVVNYWEPLPITLDFAASGGAVRIAPETNYIVEFLLPGFADGSTDDISALLVHDADESESAWSRTPGCGYPDFVYLDDYPFWDAMSIPIRVDGEWVKAACPADVDGDGSVGPADLGILLGAWGSRRGPDLDGDGVTGAGDLGVLLGAWGACD